MKEKIHQVKFENSQVPNSHFDIVKIEDILKRNMEPDPSTLHSVNFYNLMLITKGQGYHTIDFTDYKYKEGVVLTIRKDQIQKFFRSGETEGYMVLFTDDFMLGFLQDVDAVKSLQIFNEFLGPPKIQLDEAGNFDLIHLVTYMENEYLKVGDEHSPGIIRSLLYVLLTKLYRSKTSQNPEILEKKYLQDFIAFQALVEQKCFLTKKVSDYAEELGYSSKKLNLVVQNIVHKPAKTFIDEMAILQIKRLLIKSQLSVKEIAYTAGFEEPSNLYKYFKRYTDASPEAFRKAYR